MRARERRKRKKRKARADLWIARRERDSSASFGIITRLGILLAPFTSTYHVRIITTAAGSYGSNFFSLLFYNLG